MKNKSRSRFLAGAMTLVVGATFAGLGPSNAQAIVGCSTAYVYDAGVAFASTSFCTTPPGMQRAKVLCRHNTDPGLGKYFMGRGFPRIRLRALTAHTHTATLSRRTMRLGRSG